MSETTNFTTLTPDKSETERFLKILNPMNSLKFESTAEAKMAGVH